MSHNSMHVRKLSQGFTDIEKCAASFVGRHATDDKFLHYPATTVLVAEDGKDSVYMPVQTCLVPETIGYQEGISNISLAKAMQQLISVLVWEARRLGIGELIFYGNNQQTIDFACNNGFEEMPWKVYRLKVNEPNGDEEPISRQDPV